MVGQVELQADADSGLDGPRVLCHCLDVFGDGREDECVCDETVGGECEHYCTDHDLHHCPYNHDLRGPSNNHFVITDAYYEQQAKSEAERAEDDLYDNDGDHEYYLCSGGVHYHYVIHCGTVLVRRAGSPAQPKQHRLLSPEPDG